jgi:hypothetical protein
LWAGLELSLVAAVCWALGHNSMQSCPAYCFFFKKQNKKIPNPLIACFSFLEGTVDIQERIENSLASLLELLKGKFLL